VKQFFTPFNLEEEYNTSEKLGLSDLSSACMPALSLTDILELYDTEKQEEFCFELLNKPLSYSSQYGSEEFRTKLASQIYPHLKAKNFLLTSGASEAIYLVMKTMLQPGDSIIVQKPIYQSLYQIAFDAGVNIIDWDCDLKNYQWQISDLAKLIQDHPQAKALVINNPNNPTGIGFSASELREISQILEDRLLISDEVFLCLSRSETCSATQIHPRALAISDLSKSFSMPGLRLGWIGATDSMLEHLETFSGLKNYLSLRCSTLSELIGSWVIDRSKKIIKTNKTILSQNIDSFFSSQFYKECFNTGFSSQKIDGLNCFLEFREDLDLKKFMDICKQKKVFLAQGELFGDKYERYCRIGLGQLDTEKLKQLTKSLSAAHT